jgi:2-keto-4-pentenoate hydratase/2-oxohepta-3-ene-1,7-dioic acid hydratase in catechol pathway
LFVLICSALGVLTLFASAGLADDASKTSVVRYVRFQVGDTISYGVLEGDRIRKLDGDLFSSPKKTDKTYAQNEVKLLVPTRPTQVLAMAGNYSSHLKDGEVPPKFQIVQPFFKSPSCLLANGGNIELPADAESVHYEAEMVIVIGKKAKNVAKSEALQYVFGVTCGNDVSARVWQKSDVQWWRAKGADTFGPCGPYIATGLNYDDLLMTLRLNGEVRQQERTDHLIHDVAATVSGISQSVTLHPGDLIFSGTPGKTDNIKPGDMVEVEIEGVGVLRNYVTAEE